MLKKPTDLTATQYYTAGVPSDAQGFTALLGVKDQAIPADAIST